MARRVKKKRQKTINELRMLLLRRASYRWIYKYEAMKAAKVVTPDGFYLNGKPKFKTQFKCNHCKKLFGAKQVQADHIVPVIDPKLGFTNWDDYINRLLCETSGYQILCKAKCHKLKSQDENKIRRKRSKS